MKKVIAAVVGILSIVGLTLLPARSLEAQNEGEQLQFIIPYATPVYSGDLLLFTGRSQGTTSWDGGCGGSPGHVYDAMLINPGGGQAARRVEVIVIRDDAVSPGTRLGDLEPLGSCERGTGGSLYNVFHAFVQ